MYGQSHSSTLPTVSSTVGPTYATQINAAITELRTTVDAKVTPAGIEIDDDVSFFYANSNVYFGPKDVQYVGFKNETVTNNQSPNFLHVKNGELYFNDNAANQVKITNSGVVNIASSGGITGTGYGTGGVEVNWSSGNAAYLLRSGTGTNDYADAWVDDVKFNDGSDHFALLGAQSMSADASFALPTAAPAGTSLMLMDSSGNMSTSLTPTITSLTTTGAVVVGTTTTSTGLITATAGLTAAANQHVTVSGTGRHKHGNIEEIIPVIVVGANANVVQSAGVTSYVNFATTTTGADAVIFAVPGLVVGKRVQTLTFDLDFTTAGSSGNLAFSFYRITGASSATLVTSAGTSGGADQTVTLSPAHTILTDNHYYIVAGVVGGWDREVRLININMICDWP